jgi:hypothetical protein
MSKLLTADEVKLLQNVSFSLCEEVDLYTAATLNGLPLSPLTNSDIRDIVMESVENLENSSIGA